MIMLNQSGPRENVVVLSTVVTKRDMLNVYTEKKRASSKPAKNSQKKSNQRNMGIIDHSRSLYSLSSTGPQVQNKFWSPKASSTRVTVGQNFFSSSKGNG
jgi:hypothetical protein